MEFVANVTDDIRVWGTTCGLKSNGVTATYSVFFLDLLLIHLATKFLHEFLRRYGQPRMVSDFIIGMLVGNVNGIGSSVQQHIGRALKLVGESSMVCYMFVLGLEMEPRAMMQHPGWETVIAYTGVLSTFVVTFAFYPVIIAPWMDIIGAGASRVQFMAALAVVLANTASPTLTRITTDLKIGRSHVGRLIVGAAIATDMATTFAASLAAAVVNSPYQVWQSGDDGMGKDLLAACWALFVLFSQTMFILVVVPRFAEWINDRNPEGKPMKGFDLALSLALVLGLTEFGNLVNFNAAFNAFLVGLAFPKEGRLSNMLINKINFAIMTFGLPYYLCSIGIEMHIGAWNGSDADAQEQWNSLLSFGKLAMLGFIGSFGKISGAIAAALIYGFDFKEAGAIGLLLNIKGHFHIYCAYLAKQRDFINENTFLVLLFDIICTIVIVPLVVPLLVKKVRRTAERPLMTLQGLEPSAEVNMIVGVLTPQNVVAAATVVEAAKGRSAALTTYAMDLVELNDRTAAALVQTQEGGGQDASVATFEDPELNIARAEIGRLLEQLVEERGGEWLAVVRLLAISSYYNMHDDVCQAAMDAAAVLIVMPYHRSRRRDGRGMESLHPGFRQVNRKVLQHAPCSVGIVVDRGMSFRNNPNNNTTGEEKGPTDKNGKPTSPPRKVAVIFIGGCDDREALAFAGRVARHPGFHLTAIRFLPEAGAETKLARTRGMVVEKTLQEQEMQLDDECFARFFEAHVASGRVSYLEKYVGCGADAVGMLHAIGGQYSLFIVGRGGKRNPVLTAGLSDWAECPELGPVGDILSAAGFSESASVLIVQQHDIGRDQDSSDDEHGLN